MAQDPTPPPAPEPAPKHGRGLLNKAQSEELTKADQIGIAAQKADRPVALAARDISSGFVTQALADITAARAKSTEAVTDTTGTRTASVAEDTSERSLIAAMQEVQTAAKQKYARTQPEKLQDYYVGRKLLGNRALLEQYSQGIINKLGSDTLPGITPAKVTTLGTLRDAYISTNSAQTGSQSDATTARTALDGLVKAITDKRIAIQYAADAEWPHPNKANAGIRRQEEFAPDRPFNVQTARGTPPSQPNT